MREAPIASDLRREAVPRRLVTSRPEVVSGDDTFQQLHEKFTASTPPEVQAPEAKHETRNSKKTVEERSDQNSNDVIHDSNTEQQQQQHASAPTIQKPSSERKSHHSDVTPSSAKSRFRDDIRTDRAAFTAVNVLPAHLLRSKEDIISADLAHQRERIGSKELAIRKLRDNIRRSSRSSRESLDRSRENLLDKPRHAPRMRQHERRDVTRDDGERSSDTSTSQRYDYATFIARSRSAIQGDSESDDVSKRFRSARLTRHRESTADDDRRRRRSKEKPTESSKFVLLAPEVLESQGHTPEQDPPRPKSHRRHTSGSRERRHRDSSSRNSPPPVSAPRRPRSSTERRHVVDDERIERPKTSREDRHSGESSHRSSSERRSSHLRREATFDGATYTRRRHRNDVEDEQVRAVELRRQQSGNFPYAALILRNPEKLRPRSNRERK